MHTLPHLNSVINSLFRRWFRCGEPAEVREHHREGRWPEGVSGPESGQLCVRQTGAASLRQHLHHRYQLCKEFDW